MLSHSHYGLEISGSRVFMSDRTLCWSMMHHFSLSPRDLSWSREHPLQEALPGLFLIYPEEVS
jgi:hypothetical protein